MQQIFAPYNLFYVFALGLSSIGLAQTTVKQVNARPTASVEGKDLYREYCAACHGVDGKGAGPAASALKKAPSDLTRMAAANHGSFPEERIMRIFAGQESLPSHGSEAMPVWGAVFSNVSPNVELKQTRIHSLLNYLEKIQVK